LVAAVIWGCGKSTDGELNPAPQDKSVFSASAGQVMAASAGEVLIPYAAARVAEQVSFGSTSALTAELSSKGLETWITDQYSLPASQIAAPEWVVNFDTQNQAASDRAWNYLNGTYYDLLVSAPDQLRLRVSWALFNFIPVNSKVQSYGVLEHVNLLLDTLLCFGELSLHKIQLARLNETRQRHMQTVQYSN
jgi:hypothetical protein